MPPPQVFRAGAEVQGLRCRPLLLLLCLVHPSKGTLKGLDLVGTSMEEGRQPHPFLAQRTYQRIFIHVGPLHLLGLLARQHHGPAQYVQIFLGRGWWAGVMSLPLPLRPSCSASPCVSSPPGGAHTPEQTISGAVSAEAGAGGLGGGGGPPQSHLCVDADGADGRDLKIVTCEGRGGRGGPGWCSRPKAPGSCALGCVCSPDWSLGLPFSGVTPSESCPFSAPCYCSVNGTDTMRGAVSAGKGRRKQSWGEDRNLRPKVPNSRMVVTFRVHPGDRPKCTERQTDRQRDTGADKLEGGWTMDTQTDGHKNGQVRQLDRESHVWKGGQPA